MPRIHTFKRDRMKIGLKWIILAFSFSALLSACVWSSNGGSPDPPPGTAKSTWVAGSKTVNQAGIYGTQGSADSSNVPGGRHGAVSWVDSGGKLWLFGGTDYTGGYFNDLWKHDPTTGKWTWVSGSNTTDQAGVYGTQGTASPSTVPGAREFAASWIDPQGKFWLFGGWGLDSAGTRGFLNDLWKYDQTTLEWTWVSGSIAVGQSGVYGTQGIADSSNLPGGRYGAAFWIDSSGKFWLFGGWCLDSAGTQGDLNDLWKYDPTTLEWTWVSGSNTMGQAGIYGTRGTAAPSNVPGGRDTPLSWIDSSGKLWLFGGGGYDSTGTVGHLNDLWKYDPTTLEWTWVSGSSFVNQASIYGTQGTAAPSNVLGANCGAVSWLDSSGKVWIFGGEGYDSVGTIGYLNHLWKYDPTTLEWTWVSGSKTVNQAGNYGTQGTTASSNVPGGREYAVSWIDSSGELWLFGGRGLDWAGHSGSLNDMWKITR